MPRTVSNTSYAMIFLSIIFGATLTSADATDAAGSYTQRTKNITAGLFIQRKPAAGSALTKAGGIGPCGGYCNDIDPDNRQDCESDARPEYDDQGNCFCNPNYPECR